MLFLNFLIYFLVSLKNTRKVYKKFYFIIHIPFLLHLLLLKFPYFLDFQLLFDFSINVNTIIFCISFYLLHVLCSSIYFYSCSYTSIIQTALYKRLGCFVFYFYCSTICHILEHLDIAINTTKCSFAHV